MKGIFLILSVTVCRSWTGPISPLSLVPFRKDMPEEEYKKHIYVNLVRKSWTPDIDEMPDLSESENPDEPLDRYPGDIDAALRSMERRHTLQCCANYLVDAVEFLHVESCGHNPDLDTIIIVTTLSGHAGDSMSRNIVLGMAMRNMLRKYNVFIFDMSAMEKSMGLTGANSVLGVKGNYKGVSRTVAEFVRKAGVIKVSGINLIGFCYSGQLVGHIAKAIRKEFKERINSVLSLDPFSLGFARLVYKGPSLEDAKAIHTYHTNSFIMGTLRKAATVDIEFNGGNLQPGCGASPACSHQRAFVFLWFLIIYPNLFIARKCSNSFHFTWCHCIEEDTLRLTFPPSGNEQGIFQIKTSNYAPYGIGTQGADTSHCRAKRVKKEWQKRSKIQADGKMAK